MDTRNLTPVKASERYIVLDALRGFALSGIALANFPEFSLFNFLGPEAAEEVAGAKFDSLTRYLQYVLVDGKFYTIFSLLFGIGFSIILGNASKKGVNGFRIFYRRMGVLTLIGFLHLMFIWSGDILMLYALMGMLLPLFRNISDRGLLKWAAVLLFMPVLIDAGCELTGTNLSAPIVEAQQKACARYGINSDNFAYWLRDAESYKGTFQFLLQGALVRMQEFVDGNRYFKVLGLFLIGFHIGRKRIFADLESRRNWLRKVFSAGVAVGLPLSLAYAWSAFRHHPWGLAAHSLLYFASVYPLGFAYMAGIPLLYLKCKNGWLWRMLAAPGRMALTNYIGQSVIGMLLFYGIGLGFGASIGLFCTECVVAAVFLFQVAFSRIWLHFFQFGPLEWLWRMLTYGKVFTLIRKRER